MSTFYDGTKLLSLTDINGKKPEIYICTSNRSAGKTTYFNRLAVKRFIEKKEKFCLLYRYNYELDDCADKFFKDIQILFFRNRSMHSERRASGIYHELFLDDIPCGYAISMNSADQIKKYSHFFSDTRRIIFDEFQSETGNYCSNEIKKFISIHTSIARGNGEQAKYLPVYMISNPVSIVNPYYIELGISERLQENTRFLRGNGFVLEQGFNESASLAQRESGFNKAFSDNKYISYSTQNVYLNDNKAFIDNPQGKNRYICTIKYDNTEYGIREYAENGYLYVNQVADTSYPIKITTTTNDHNVNYVMLKRNAPFINTLKAFFEKGSVRFKDMRSKEAFLSMLKYT